MKTNHQPPSEKPDIIIRASLEVGGNDTVSTVKSIKPEIWESMTQPSREALAHMALLDLAKEIRMDLNQGPKKILRKLADSQL